MNTLLVRVKECVKVLQLTKKYSNQLQVTYAVSKRIDRGRVRSYDKGRENMAKALGLRDSSPSQVLSLRTVWILRLALGFTVLLGATIFFLGTSWDIQWHSFIGRDRTLIPPHIVMLSGVTLSGLAAMAAVLSETLWARRSTTIAYKSTGFADAFHGSLGAYIAGFGALDAAIGFPLDSYWHALYGIDVAIWAPFHVMIIVGMALVALGAIYMLMSATHLAAQVNARGATRTGYIGVVVAFAVTLCILTFLLFDAYGDMGTINLGFVVINLFTGLAALLGTWTFVSAAYALPWRWAATSVALVSLLLVGIVFLYVPPATDFLLQLEQLSYRHPGLQHLVVVAIDWPAAFLLAAIISDSILRRAKRRGWSPRKQILIVSASTLIGFLPIPIISPLYPLYLAGEIGIAGTIVTLFLGLLGACVGSWLGRNTGESLSSLER
jgi:hypothetical protein